VKTDKQKTIVAHLVGQRRVDTCSTTPTKRLSPRFELVASKVTTLPLWQVLLRFQTLRHSILKI